MGPADCYGRMSCPRNESGRTNFGTNWCVSTSSSLRNFLYVRLHEHKQFYGVVSVVDFSFSVIARCRRAKRQIALKISIPHINFLNTDFWQLNCMLQDEVAAATLIINRPVIQARNISVAVLYKISTYHDRSASGVSFDNQINDGTVYPSSNVISISPPWKSKRRGLCVGGNFRRPFSYHDRTLNGHNCTGQM